VDGIFATKQAKTTPTSSNFLTTSEPTANNLKTSPSSSHPSLKGASSSPAQKFSLSKKASTTGTKSSIKLQSTLTSALSKTARSNTRNSPIFSKESSHSVTSAASQPGQISNPSTVTCLSSFHPQTGATSNTK